MSLSILLKYVAFLFAIYSCTNPSFGTAILLCNYCEKHSEYLCLLIQKMQLVIFMG